MYVNYETENTTAHTNIYLVSFPLKGLTNDEGHLSSQISRMLCPYPKGVEDCI